MTTLFLFLRLVFNFLASIGEICWLDDADQYESQSFSLYGLNILEKNNNCHYNFEFLGSFGEVFENSYKNKGFLYILLVILNWMHLFLNLGGLVLISILLKITFSNVSQGTTTYERHLVKMAKKDTTLRRELNENFLSEEVK
jgi:hypothetical protein